MVRAMRRGLTGILSALFVAIMLVAAPTLPATANGFGEVKTTDYGTAPVSGGAYCWRGYAFKPSETTTVTHLIGGGTKSFVANSEVFRGAIYAASGGGGSSPGAPSTLLGAVTFTSDTFNQVVQLSSQVTLSANNWYFIAQGRVVGTVLHHYVSTFDRDGLVNGNDRIADWAPATSSPGEAYYWGCNVSETALIGSTPSTNSSKPALGFRYVSNVNPTTVTTNPSSTNSTDGDALGVSLTSTGGGTASLWVEYSQSSNFLSADTRAVTVQGSIPSAATMPVNAIPTVTTSGNNFIFTYASGTTVTLAENRTYYWRARGTNDYGAVNGNIWAMSLGDADNHPARIWVNMAEGTTAPAIPPTALPAPNINSATVTSQDGALSILPVVEGVIDNYEYSFDNGVNWVVRNPSSNTLPLVIPDLSNGQSYSILLRARNIDAVSTNFTITGTPGLPAAPANPSVTAGVESLSVSFDPAAAPADAPVLDYEFSIDGGSTWASSSSASSPITISAPIVQSGVSYQVAVRARNTHGTGPASSPVITAQPLALPTVTLTYNAAVYKEIATVNTLNKGGSSGAATFSIVPLVSSDLATNCAVDSSTGAVSASSAGVCKVRVDVAASGTFAAGSAEVMVTIAKSADRILFDTGSPLTVYAPDGSTRTINLAADPDDSEKFYAEIKLGETLALPFNSPNAERPGYTSYFKCTSVVGPGQSVMFPFDGSAPGDPTYGDSIYYLKAKQIGACNLYSNSNQPAPQILTLLAKNYTDRISQQIFVNVIKGDQNPISVNGPSTAEFGTEVVLDAIGGSGLGDRSYSVTGPGCAIETIPFVYAGVSYPALASAKLTSTGAGSCDVSVSKAGDRNYEPITSAPYTVTFSKGRQQLSFTSNVPSNPSAGASYTPVAQSSSGLPVTLTASGSCSFDQVLQKVDFSGAGSCVISANQAGDNDYLAASQITQTVVVGERNQTITFAAIADREFGDPAFLVTASSTEVSLSPTILSLTTGVCSVDSSGVVVLKSAGTCTLEATQAGQAGVVAPASAVRRSFEIYPAGSSAPFVTSVSRGLGSLTATLIPPSYTGGQAITKYEVTAFDPNGDPVAFNNNCAVVTPQKCTIDGLEEGIPYTIKARAYHSAGFGSQSPASIAAAPVGNPDAVRELTALAGDTTLTISWLSPASLGGASFARYEVFVKLASENAFPNNPSHTIMSAADGNYTFTGMTNGESYDVKMVTITDLEGSEIVSNTALVSQTPYTTPNAVTNLTAFEVGDDLYVSWSYPDFDGGRPVTAYDVDVNSGSDGCQAVSSTLCVIPKAGETTFSILTTPTNLAGSGFPASYTYSVPTVQSPGSGGGYLGPIVSGFSSRSPESGTRVLLFGQRLEAIETISISGIALEFSLTLAGGISFVFPGGLEAGFHDLVITSAFGQLRIQQAFEIRSGTEAQIIEFGAELRVTPLGETKLYVFDVVGVGKVQVFVNGVEIAWVRAESADHPKLRILSTGEAYLVRTIKESDRVQVLVDGEELEVVRG